MLASIEGAARVLSGSIYKEGGINGWERSRSNFLPLAPRGVSSNPDKGFALFRLGTVKFGKFNPNLSNG